MLGAITKAVTNLAAIILLSVILDLILPGETMRKYARFVAGMLTMLAVLTPIIGFLSSAPLPEYSASLTLTEAAIAYSNAAIGIERPEENLLRLVKTQAERAAKNYGLTGATAKAVIEDGILWVYIRTPGDEAPDDESVASLQSYGYTDRVREYIARSVDISADNIVIEGRSKR